MWVMKDGCEEIVKRVWERNGGSNPALEMIYKGEQCQMELVQWSKNTNPNKCIEQTKAKLMEFKKGMQTDLVKAEIAKLLGELEKLYQD